MDGENNGKPYFLMDDLGVPLFLETPLYIYLYVYIPLQGTELGDLLGAKLAKMNRSDW